MQIFSLLLFFGTGMVVMAAAADGSEDEFDREDLFDRTTRKLKPVRQVMEDHMVKDFPKIRDCGPDETQNWYEPDPEDCSCYFVCTGKYYVHRKCSPGLVFDVKSHDCNWPDVVSCGDRPSPWTIPEYPGPHNNHQHYNVYEYTISGSKIQKSKHHTHDENHWLAFDKMENDDNFSYEYFM